MKSDVMRKSNTQKISEVINEYLKDSGLKKKLTESRITNHWEELMGKIIAKRTKSVYIKDKTLFVFLNSSVLRNELMMMRQEIIDTLNKRVGENVIDDIRLK